MDRYSIVMIVHPPNTTDMIYANDRLEGMTKYKVNKIKDKVMEYCVNTLGYRKRLGVSGITLSYIECEDWGMYDPDSHHIYVYMKNIKTVSDLTRTIIHEYTHSVQDISKSYSKLYKKFGYDNHPMEVEAYGNEKIYNRKVLNYIRRELK